MAKVVVFGCGRGADVACRHLTHDSEHEVVGFTVDADYMDGDKFFHLPVVPFEAVEEAFPPDDFSLFALLGYQKMNGLRQAKYLAGKDKGYDFVSYVSSSLFTVEPLVVGENCFILDNQSINLDVRIGNNVVMWSSNHVGDESVIGDHVWISSHATLSGGVVVEERAFIGIGATIGNRVTVAEGSFIGAHALINGDTEPGRVYAAESAGPVADDAVAFMRILEATGKL